MAGIYPLSRMQQFDSNGKPLSGARLFLYEGGTSTPRIGYRDLALSSAHPNPILADSAGRLPLIYLDDGYYRHRLTTSTGPLVFDDDGVPVLSTSAGGAGTTVDPDSVFKTRDIKIRFDDSTIDGYVRLNGKSIGSAASGATERANADTQSLYEELWSFDNIVLDSITKGASAAADFAANKPLVLPNAQGAALFGLPNMGGTADTAFAALLSGTNTSEPGATGGADTVTISQGNLPAVSLTGSGTITSTGTSGIESASHVHGVTDPGHFHSTESIGGIYGTTQTSQGVDADIEATALGGGANAVDLASRSTGPKTTGITLGAQSANHTHDVTVTGNANQVSTPLGGSGTALNKLPSLLTVMLFIRL